MNYKRCLYFVEGKCEEQLINALKVEPRLLIPGKVKVHNVIQDDIPRREVNMIQPGTMVALVFDTDVNKTDTLIRNIRHIKQYASQVRIIYLAQVLNFEDELVRATDVKKIQDLTKSGSVRDFKSDFCRMKTEECRSSLDRHRLDVTSLWAAQPPTVFSFVDQNGKAIKI